MARSGRESSRALPATRSRRRELDEVISQAKDRLESQGQKIPAAGSQEYQAFQQNALQFLVQRAQFEQQAEKLGVVAHRQGGRRAHRARTDAVLRRQPEEVRGRAREAGHHRRAGARRASRRRSSGEDLRESGRHREGHRRRDQGVLRRPPRALRQQPSRRVRHILVSSKALADDIYGQLANGADFAALAKKYSTDSSKDIGGKLTIQKGQTVPQFEKAALRAQGQRDLEAGQDPVRLAHHRGSRAVEQGEDDSAGKREARRSTTRSLGQKRSDAVTKWLEDLKQEYADKIEYASGFAPPDYVARDGYHRDRLSLEQALVDLQRADRAAAPRVPLGRGPDRPHDRPPHRRGGLRGRGRRDGGRRREARRRAR